MTSVLDHYSYGPYLNAVIGFIFMPLGLFVRISALKGQQLCFG